MKALIDAFEEMGARARVELVLSPTTPDRRRAFATPTREDEQRDVLRTLRIDIGRDARGEFFDVRCDARVGLSACDVRPGDRHLLLEATTGGAGDGDVVRSAFLCGHDEKAWFVAAIPESAGARDVQAAKDALKPQAV